MVVCRYVSMYTHIPEILTYLHTSVRCPIYLQSQPVCPDNSQQLRQRTPYNAGRKDSAKRPRANQEIRTPTVLLISDAGKKVLPTAEALQLAQDQGLDLIEVAAVDPPVVKIGDLGQFIYKINKQERKAKAHSKQTEVKMLRFGFRTEKHDLDRLRDRAKEFLAEKHLVKFVVRLRGRENANKEYAEVKLKNLVAELSDVADLEQEVKKQGNMFACVVRPKKNS